MKLRSIAFVLALSSAVPVSATSLYTQTKSVALGAPDRWDYVVYDDTSDRVFVAHGDRVTVVNAKIGSILGEVTGIPGGTHGIAVSVATQQGFTDDGRNGKAISFSLVTFKPSHEIPVDLDADAIVLDRTTGHAFVIEGDPGAISVVDPKTDNVITTIKVGEKLEFAVADGHGTVFVAGEQNRDVIKVDARVNKVVARWTTPGCESPHGLAIDARSHRLFMGCLNSLMMVVDSENGRVVASLPIGRGSDAVAFDPSHKRVFSSNGIDGTVTVYQQFPADKYVLADVIATKVSGRTMDVDPKSGRLFIAASDPAPGLAANGRPNMKPGSLKLMIFDPRNERR